MRTILMTDYLFDPHAVRHPIHNFTTRVLLTRKLPQMVPVMAQELKDAFAERLGSDTENWKEVQIVDTLREISGRTVNRVFIGDDPLCQNQEYLDSLLFVAGELDKAAAKLRKVHWLVRPLVASYITRPYQKAMRKVLDFTNPIVIRRKEAVARQDKTQLEKEMEEPDDFLQFLIQQSITQKNDIDPTPNMISLRLALMNFASVQNLSRSGSNTILDLVNAPPELNVIETLRQEISDVTAQDGEGALSKDQLGKMERLDSVIKESMRISHVSTVGIQRMVTAPNGIPVPGGRTVPKGFLVGTSAISLHLDDDYYPNAKEWRPFRFYEDSHRPSDPKNDNSQEAKNTEFMRQKRNALTFTSDEFLAFGHGTHACPGRFYSAALLKTLIIVLLQEYDLRPQTERAENEWVSGAFVPSANATVQVRKKKVPMSGGV
ncbi:MAG: hypothetical protein M4579_006311 [Chaenotheca gracillima]|nr:MAG: hypothetical protein M4579_006311 [Chaenotheca gracillima]